jgi:hypothetical protein
MVGFHATLGWLAPGAGIVVTLAALATLILLPRPPSRVLAGLTVALAALVTALLLATMFAGGLLLITGLRPLDMLHVLIGIAAPAALPVALAMGWWRERQGGGLGARSRWIAAGGLAVVLLGTLLGRTG